MTSLQSIYRFDIEEISRSYRYSAATALIGRGVRPEYDWFSGQIRSLLRVYKAETLTMRDDNLLRSVAVCDFPIGAANSWKLIIDFEASMIRHPSSPAALQIKAFNIFLVKVAELRPSMIPYLSANKEDEKRQIFGEAKFERADGKLACQDLTTTREDPLAVSEFLRFIEQMENRFADGT